MAFFNEFPNTRTYDSDLGWLIKTLGTMLDQVESLTLREDIDREDIKKIKNDIEEILTAIKKPIDDWDAAKTYPIYSMVTYEDKMYVAVQDVPLGVGIGDTRYWEESAGLVTLISALQSDVADIMAEQDRPSGSLLAIGYKTPVTAHDNHTQNAFNIIRTKTGKTIFVDFGWEYTTQDLAATFAAYGIDSIDVIIISHYHGDHIGNFAKTLELLNVNESAVAYIPTEPSLSWDEGSTYRARYNEIVTALTDAGIEIVNPTDTHYAIDDNTSVDFFNTGNEAYYIANGTTDTQGYNNNSYCCYLNTDGTSILFTGDIEELAREYLMPEFHRASILQMPHHGYGLKYPEDMLNKICPDALICNNADGVTPESAPSTTSPRLWNALYVQAKQTAKPVFCTSDAPAYDLIMLLDGKLTANAADHETPYDEAFGRGEYSGICTNVQEFYGAASTKTYNDLLDAIRDTSKVLFAAYQKINMTPRNACIVENVKTNAGAYSHTFGNEYFNINRYTCYDLPQAGELITHEDGNGNKTHLLHNNGMGNFYRFNSGSINAGATNSTPTLSLNHGSDINTDNNVNTTNNWISTCMFHVYAIFAAPPTTGYLRIKVGSKNVDFYPNAKNYTGIMFETNFSANAKIEVINNTDQNITASVFHMLPISYAQVNLSSYGIE